MSDWPVSGEPGRVFISPHSPGALGVEYAALAVAAPASVAWGTANMVRLYPFVLPEPMLVLKLWAYNGATISGFTSIGAYTEDGTLMVSAAIVQTGTNVVQEFEVTDTVLGRGRYYMALQSNATGATYFSTAVSVEQSKVLGWAQAALAGAGLTATITLAAATAAIQPVFGLSGRVLVA